MDSISTHWRRTARRLMRRTRSTVKKKISKSVNVVKGSSQQWAKPTLRGYAMSEHAYEGMGWGEGRERGRDRERERARERDVLPEGLRAG